MKELRKVFVHIVGGKVIQAEETANGTERCCGIVRNPFGAELSDCVRGLTARRHQTGRTL